MSQYFSLHPVNPQLRLIRGAVEILRAGGVGEAGDLCEHGSHPAERPAMGSPHCGERAGRMPALDRARSRKRSAAGGAGHSPKDGP